jgi:hypothetical protein
MDGRGIAARARMRRLLGGALRVRWRQATALLLLGTIASAAATAAAAAVDSAARSARLAAVDAHPPGALGYTVDGSLPVNDVARVDELADRLTRATVDLWLTTVVGLYRAASVTVPRSPEPVGRNVVARDDVCAHVAIVGACATSAGDVVVPAGLGVGVGDTVTVATGSAPVRLRVAGVYRVLAAREPYWSVHRVETEPPLFVSRATALALGPETVAVTVDLLPTDSETLAVDADRLRASVAAVRAAAPPGFSVDDRISPFADEVERSDDRIRIGAMVGVAPMVLIALLALVLVIRHAAVQRRPELALVAMRGVPRWQRMWVAGAPTVTVLSLAAALGYLLATVPRFTWDPRSVAVFATTAALVIGSAALVEWRALAIPVNQALRSIPPRDRWSARSGLLDVVVLALAAAASFQAVEAPGSAGLALLAPALIPLACGLIAVRAVRPAAGRGRAFSAGPRPAGYGPGRVPARPATRRARTAGPGGDRDRARGAGCDELRRRRPCLPGSRPGRVGSRSSAPLGRTTDSELMAAVRRADPDGRWAMAVSRSGDPDSPVLAVQSDRLAAVSNWPLLPTATPDWVSARLRPESNPPVLVDGAGLVLDAEVIGAEADRAGITVHLLGDDGRWTQVAFDLVGRGRAANLCRAGLGLRIRMPDRLAGTAGQCGRCAPVRPESVRAGQPDRFRR